MVEEQPPDVRDEFYAEARRFPEIEEALEAQKTIIRIWRNDPRFEPYWSVLDSLLARSMDQVRLPPRRPRRNGNAPNAPLPTGRSLPRALP
jgi:hypothetical protein